MDRYRKEVLQVSTRKHGINVQYLYDNCITLYESKLHTWQLWFPEHKLGTPGILHYKTLQLHREKRGKIKLFF